MSTDKILKKYKFYKETKKKIDLRHLPQVLMIHFII